MRVVVTGGAGFIGSHVSDAFIEAGHEVLIIDDLSSGREENVNKRAELIKADIVDADLEKTMKTWRAEVVSHHAAQISVRESVIDPVFDLRKNILGTVRLLEACRATGCSKFIFACTGGALYGDQSAFPAPETHPTYPLSPYGISKLAAEKYLYFYRKQHGLKGVSLRYSNVYGPRQDPHGEAGVVAIFCKKILADDVLTINGDGRQTRDFVYVGDVAKANVKALEADVEGEFNVCTGLEMDVNLLAEKLVEISGRKPRIEHGPPMPGEQRRSVLDPKLASLKLGWAPEVSISDGLKKTFEFFKNKSAN